MEEEQMVKAGDVVTWNNTEVVFLEKKQVWWIGYHYAKKNFLKFKGNYTPTGKTDNEIRNKWFDMKATRDQPSEGFQNLKPRQAFMFKGEKYYLVSKKSKKAEVEHENGILMGRYAFTDKFHIIDTYRGGLKIAGAQGVEKDIADIPLLGLQGSAQE